MGAKRTLVAGFVGVACLLAACGDDEKSAVTTGATQSSSASTAAAATPGMKTEYPITVTDCGGHTSTFTEAPKRTVTLDPQAYELMFWLGLGEQQLAAGPQPLPAVPEQFQEATTRVEVISEDENDGHSEYISKETLLAAKPDFVYGSYASAFTPPAVYSEAELGDKGINVYYSLGIGGCVGDDAAVPRTNLDSIFADIENLGKIFDVQDTAAALTETMKADLAAAVATAGEGAGAKVTALGTDDTMAGTPSYWGGSSTVNAIISLAGGVNVFADMPEAYGATTLEEIIARSPEVIMLIAYPADLPAGWDDLEAYLLSQPALAEVPAIKNKRFVRVTFPEVGAGGVRNVDGVMKLAEVLSQLGS